MSLPGTQAGLAGSERQVYFSSALADARELFLKVLLGIEANGFDIVLLLEHAQYIGRDEGWQRWAETNSFYAQIEQRKEHCDGLLLKP
jgi:hypothetical protein